MDARAQGERVGAPQGQGANAALMRTTSSSIIPAKLLAAILVAVMAVAATHHMQLVEVPAWQQFQDHLQRIQDQLQTGLQQHLPKLHPVLSSIAQKLRQRSTRKLFTKEELSQYTGGVAPGHSQKIYVAILGEVFDVTSKPQFYGPGNGYACFAGTDGSKSFITGDFVGDVSDDVGSLEAEACLGLVGWLDFYHETYPYKGKLIGRFYDQSGKPTPELASVHQRAKEGKRMKADREKEEQKWPNCNTKWTQEEGGTVWCDDGLYPRKLFVSFTSGKSKWRCACFKELGWSDVRKVYAECAPDAHRCSTNAEAEKADEHIDPTAGIFS